MDNPNNSMKNVLVELESFKSKECIFKIKEINFIRDKEILEESIKAFQTDIQEKSEIIRSLRRDLDLQSSDLYKDLQIKSNELEKTVLENEDLKKQNIICQESIQHHVQRIEALKLDLKNQQSFFEREIECKSKLAGFYETSNQQKENKLFQLAEENKKNQQLISDLTRQLQEQNEINQQLNKTYEESLRLWKSDEQEKDEEIKRIKNEIVQLQQNGISELHLEKMNPIAAATLKVLKPSRGLMEIYTELHSKISEVDHLQMAKDRLLRKNDNLESELRKQLSLVDRFNTEFEELKRTSEALKGRLLGLVTELRTSESKRCESERQLLVTTKNLEYSNKEIVRLNEQVRKFIVISETGSLIKQEEVDTDSGLYASVQELQDVNRSLRLENEKLMTKLDLSDSEQYKQRCEELQVYSDKLDFELVQLRQEKSTYKNQLNLLEKQVKLLRYLTNLKAPLTVSIVENGLRLLEHDNMVCLDECEMNSNQPVELELAKQETCESSCQQSEIDSVINEFLDNKRASDQVYASSIENLRGQVMNISSKYNQIKDMFERCNEQLTEEKELNGKYQNECSLLRSLNKNLSANTANLESHIEDLKLKLECKINLFAERKVEIDNSRNQIDTLKSELMRLRIEKEELLKTVDVQTQIIANINSLGSGAGLADHFYRIQTANKISDLEKAVDTLSKQIDEKDCEISVLVTKEQERKALDTAVKTFVRSDIGCQVCLSINENDHSELVVVNSDANSEALCDSLAQIEILKQQISSEKSSKDQVVFQLNDQIEQYKIDVKDLNQKCEFFETQISLQEKARQEILNENIKLTEEAHNMNASLKLNLTSCEEELVALKIRLEEAETVKRTVQTVIDKYVKEANDAKAKYKRELTLHAADSKLLEAANREIEYLKSLDKSIDQDCAKLRMELAVCENKYKLQIEEMQESHKVLETKLLESENRNERLYDQLNEVCNQNNSSYQEIIEDLRNQINITKMSFSLSDVQTKRYVSEIAHLREEINYMQENSTMVIDQLNKSQSDESTNVIMDAEVVRESNHVLRQQKEHLERSIINVTGEMELLGEQIEKLKSNVTELKEEKSCLNKIKTDLEEEKNRWKDRCTKLVERAEQMDPEQYKNACNERDRFRKQVHELESELSEMKNVFEKYKYKSEKVKEEDNSKLEKQLDVVKELETNLGEFRSALSKCRIELETTRGHLDDEKSKLDQQVVTNNLLKDIGRKYKNESAKKRLAIIDLEKQLASVNERITSMTSERVSMESKLTELELELGQKRELLTELQSRCECLERINNDYWKKIEQVNESNMEKSSDGSNKSMKRNRDSEEGSDNEDKEPDSKRCRHSVTVTSADEDRQNFSSRSDSVDQYDPSPSANDESMNDPDVVEGNGEIDDNVEGREEKEEEFVEHKGPEEVDSPKEESIGPVIDCEMTYDGIGKEMVENVENSPKIVFDTGKKIDYDNNESIIESSIENNEKIYLNFADVVPIEEEPLESEMEARKTPCDSDAASGEEGEIDDDDEEQEPEVDEDSEEDKEGQEDEISEVENEDADLGDLSEDAGGSSGNGSVILIDDESEGDSDENEEDYDAFVSKVEVSLNQDGTDAIVSEDPGKNVNIEIRGKQSLAPTGDCANECDESWNNKLIAMVSTSAIAERDNTSVTRSEIEVSNRVMTRGRLRRQLRRLNPTD